MMTMRLSQEDINGIPNQWLETIVHYITGFRNDTVDFSRPYLRPSVVRIYPLFVLMYALLIVGGILANFAMVYHIVKYRLYRDPTYAFLINMAIADVIECIFVLPISLTVMLVQNWIFGRFLCFFLPMLQDIPLHVSMITYLLIAWDRFRMLSDPVKPRIPAFVCALGAWFFAVCIVLPYPIYTTYLDLERFMKEQFKGVGICAVNLADDMQEYMRGLFIGTYVAPLAVTAYLYVKASRELQTQEGPFAVAMFEARARDSYSRHGSRASNDITTSSRGDGKRESGSVGTGGTVGFAGLSGGYDLYDAELDVRKEKRTQKYLIFMVSVFAICLCPLMVLRLAKLALIETYENSGHFDITFTMFVWVAFMPIVTTPGFYASWQMSRPAKERLRGYFRFSNRRIPRGCEDEVKMSPRRTPRRPPAGLMNVAYTQHVRTGNVTGNNGGGGSLRGLHSPDLVSNYSIQVTSLVE
ncbi:orexin/Hypocretin receptor type 1 [Athalia rosae]|uniref:orexin/Hypocretin receptor type 1 n=1 Tax=Athalia rosae TaxID=37344 RepID=UPI0006260524|nr:orexin/Hypocretin receptor type 1 [Athalia rosae]